MAAVSGLPTALIILENPAAIAGRAAIAAVVRPDQGAGPPGFCFHALLLETNCPAGLLLAKSDPAEKTYDIQEVDSSMTAGAKIYPVSSEWSRSAQLDAKAYERLYRQSIDDPEAFWAERGEEFLSWDRSWDKVLDWRWAADEVRHSWFDGGALNVCYNCVDRHLESRGDQTAIIWEGDDPGRSRTLTYRELHAEVCRFANTLKHLGIKKGDRVCIYMPMIPEAAVAMLACARIGAIHSVVFGGFSPEALRERIRDSSCSLVITADQGIRGNRLIPLKDNTDQARAGLGSPPPALVVRCTGNEVAMQPGLDHSYEELKAGVSADCPAEPMDAEHPLFILYTSGSTGKPKGVLHTSAGYLLYAAVTHKYVFDYRDGDVYWCTADVGWVTGHSYIVYGPLANGATTLMFEGVPTWPDVGRFWQVVDKHKVSIFYTAPTAIRALMSHGDGPVKASSRSSLRLLGTVGEPINPEAWEWYYHVVGDSRCPIVDTWWQTETGGHMITPLPGATALKPGSVTRPFFGVVPALVDDEGREIDGEGRGNLVINKPWPGQMRSLYGDHQRFIDAYFSTFPGRYFTGDGAERDSDGDYWIIGRVDDVLNVSGHRLGTAEIESALVLHVDVAEAAVVACPHPIKGQGIYAFVTPMVGVEGDEDLRDALKDMVRQEIGAFARPDCIQFSPSLPKTRSGKIMRRILRKIAADDCDDFGDTSTLAEPEIVAGLVANRLRPDA